MVQKLTIFCSKSSIYFISQNPCFLEAFVVFICSGELLQKQSETGTTYRMVEEVDRLTFFASSAAF